MKTKLNRLCDAVSKITLVTPEQHDRIGGEILLRCMNARVIFNERETLTKTRKGN